MSEAVRAKAGLVYNVIEAMVLLLSMGIGTWCARTVIAHGNDIAILQTEAKTSQVAIVATSSRVDNLQIRGSAGLSEHVREDDSDKAAIRARVDKLEAAVIGLQTAPGKLEAISARLDGIQKSQDRIEKTMDEHMKVNILYPPTK